MFANWLCKWFGHKWLFLPDNGAYSISFATCERCLKRERISFPEPQVVPPKPNLIMYDDTRRKF